MNTPNTTADAKKISEILKMLIDGIKRNYIAK